MRERNRKYIHAPHAWQMFVIREWFSWFLYIYIYICRRHTRYCRARIEQGRVFLLLLSFFFVSCIRRRFYDAFSREGTGPHLLRSLGVCGALLCGRSLLCATRRWLSQYTVSRTLNRNFGRILFFAPERAIARPRLGSYGRNGRAEAQRTRVSARRT